MTMRASASGEAIAEARADYHLRAFIPEDYTGVVAMGGLVFGDEVLMDVATLRRRDQDPSREHRRIVAVGNETGEMLGMAVWSQVRLTSGFFWIAVRPEDRRRGIGSALYAALLKAITPYSLLTLQTTTRADWTDTVSFLVKRNFVEVMHPWRSELPLAEFQPERFNRVGENLRVLGIVIRTFAEVDGEPGARQRVYETVNAVSKDVPSRNPYVPLSFAEWERKVIGDPHFLPDACFLAVDRATGEFVGVSTLTSLPDSDHLQTELTGVRPAYRRRGIALALKVQAIDYARAVSAPVVHTANASTNVAMLAINERLGFQRQTNRIRFLLRLRTETENKDAK